MKIDRKELQEFVERAIESAAFLLARNWIILVGLVILFLLMPVISAGWNYWSELTFDETGKLLKVTTDRTRIIQQFVLMIGGALAFVLATWRTWTSHKQAKAALEQVQVALRQANLAERAHNIDRYSKAAGMLDSERIAVRQAGVYTLLELGRADTPNSYMVVIKLLSGFARVRSAEWREKVREHEKTVYHSFGQGEIPVLDLTNLADLNEAIRSIGLLRDQRPDEVEGERTAKFQLDLSGITAAGLVLIEVDFSLVNLESADFAGAYVRLGKFRGTYMRLAKLDHIAAQWTDFERANFNDVSFEGATFTSCNFDRAQFRGAQFDGAATFRGCNISSAEFTDAKGITSANLEGAWAWADDPPKLPENVHFSHFFDAGPNGALRMEYEAREGRRGFSSPE